jgi:hypothetical protein
MLLTLPRLGMANRRDGSSFFRLNHPDENDGKVKTGVVELERLSELLRLDELLDELEDDELLELELLDEELLLDELDEELLLDFDEELELRLLRLDDLEDRELNLLINELLELEDGLLTLDLEDRELLELRLLRRELIEAEAEQEPDGLEKLAYEAAADALMPDDAIGSAGMGGVTALVPVPMVCVLLATC